MTTLQTQIYSSSALDNSTSLYNQLDVVRPSPIALDKQVQSVAGYEAMELAAGTSGSIHTFLYMKDVDSGILVPVYGKKVSGTNVYGMVVDADLILDGDVYVENFKTISVDDTAATAHFPRAYNFNNSGGGSDWGQVAGLGFPTAAGIHTLGLGREDATGSMPVVLSTQDSGSLWAIYNAIDELEPIALHMSATLDDISGTCVDIFNAVDELEPIALHMSASLDDVSGTCMNIYRSVDEIEPILMHMSATLDLISGATDEIEPILLHMSASLDGLSGTAMNIYSVVDELEPIMLHTSASIDGISGSVLNIYQAIDEIEPILLHTSASIDGMSGSVLSIYQAVDEIEPILMHMSATLDIISGASNELEPILLHMSASLDGVSGSVLNIYSVLDELEPILLHTSASLDGLSGTALNIYSVVDELEPIFLHTSASIDNIYNKVDLILSSSYYTESQWIDSSSIIINDGNGTYYPDATGYTMLGNKNISIQFLLSGTGQISGSFQATHEGSTRWIDITKAGYRMDDNTNNNSTFSVLNNTISGIVDWDDLHVKKIRWLATGSSNENAIGLWFKVTS